MSIQKEDVRVAIDQLSFEVDDIACDKLTKYLQGMLLWNKAYNLTAITEPKEMLVKHLLDSLVLAPELEKRIPNGHFIDVGTGAGLPGALLSIVMPSARFTLLDSTIKRTRFITQMKLEIGLPNVEIVTSRVQDHQPENGYDAVLSRAFASGEDMVNWSEHLVHDQGVMAAMKGKFIEEEWESVSQFPNREVIELEVPGLFEERHLIFLSK